MPARFAEELTPDSRINVSSSTMNQGSGHFNNDNSANGLRCETLRRFSPITEDVCITGLSGRFPESSNIAEFSKNLFEGVDMVNDEPRRWNRGLYDLPERMGKLKNEDLENFDQQFFGVHQKQADYMDPQLRMLLEVCYEAIFDSGINPQEIRGTRTGVYVGASNSEAEQYFCADPDRVNGYGLVGCCRAMFGNRVSFSFDFQGPSFAIDTACSSSILALDRAFADIKSGVADAAIVAGTNLNFKPTNSLQFKRLSMLSSHGTCKAFDIDGSGYVRSEGVAAIFLQKSSDARRIYSTVLNVRTNTDGYKEEGITFPNGQMQKRLIQETYDEIGLNPHDVTYIEAHGTGTKVGDPQEVNSITDFFCKDRSTPLLIGSVKSNMGHSEPASGVCAIAKLLIAMEAGIIPGNLHFKTPNPDLYGIAEGKLKVVDKNTSWNGGIVAMNSFGFGGANGHVILKSNPKSKMISPREGETKLVVCSGRTAEAVQKIIDESKRHKNDEEFIGLINQIHKKSIPQHNFRGYAVLNETETGMSEVIGEVEEKRPIWFVYTGMGSQWAKMAKDLMKFEVFNKSIHRCAEILRPQGIDLIEILTKSDDKAFDIVLNSFVSIAAMQVALTDLLTHLNIQPDGIIGHSVGELGCAYADGCFTPEQTVLAAYWRGKSIQDTKLEKGLMAAVGMTWEELHKTLPSTVFPVCHNSVDSVTISGSEADTKKVIEDLTAKGIFAKAVNSSGYAFHSKYIAEAGPKLRKSLEKIIPTPKNRSSKWISTSIPESAWNSPVAIQSSAAYHVNNLLSPVLFYEGLQHIPENAICIEIAPHGLLQAILKRALGPKVSNISLVKRGHENNYEFLLSSIGKLFTSGAQPQVPKLFRPISFPVGRGTPMLNSAVEWDHSQKWFVPNFNEEKISGETMVEINLENEDDAFIEGHTIDGRILFPATGYMALAWNTFAKIRGNDLARTAVIFENVVFHRATIINKSQPIKFGINFLEGTGEFEICESGNLTVSGKISIPENIEKEELDLGVLESEDSKISLNTDDIYKELRLRGYDYHGAFRGIVKSDLPADAGQLKWDNNWVSFMDTMLQFAIIGKELRELYLPTRIERAVLNPIKHFKMLEELEDENKILPVYMYKDINVIKSGGVEMRGLKATLAPRRSGSQISPTLEKYIFIPQNNAVELSENSDKARFNVVSSIVRTVIENSAGALKIKVVEIAHGRMIDNVLAPTVLTTIEGEPLLGADVAVATVNHVEQFTNALADSGIKITNKNICESSVGENCHLVVGNDVLPRADCNVVIENMVKTIKEDGGFLLLEENHNMYQKKENELLKKFNLTVVQEQKWSNKVFVLLRSVCNIETRNKVIINLTEKNFEWLDSLKSFLATAETENKYVYLVCQGEELFGAQGFINCIKNEAGGKFARMFFIQDKNKETFTFKSSFYRAQLERDLVSNVYKNGKWGSFKHIKLESQADVPSLQVQHAYVNALVKGDLASLKWIEGPLARQQSNQIADKNMELCTVYYAPINFRDVMLSSGKLSADALPGDLAQQDCVLGLEFSGRDTAGNRIMAMVPAKSLATTCLASKRMMWNIPDNWTMEEASTVPCVYSTVYYALVVRGQMKAGEKILIHAGSGGVGQAAISVALHHGLTVFTTVGSAEKREFLLKRFPKLKQSHIGNSRDTSFEQMILKETRGRGVDLVLNSLAEEKLQASIRCLGLNGRFLEIGKFDLSNNNPLGMSIFLKNTSFHGILLDSVMEGEEEMQALIVKLVADGIKNGAVKPLPTSVFNDEQIEQAFRYMASGRHIGKVVIKVRDEEQQTVFKPSLKFVNAIPRTYMHPDKSYIVVGGLGGFGLELTNWLVIRGAKNVVLTSRSGIKTGYQSLMIKRWTEKGVKVVIDTNDCTTKSGCKKLIENSNALGLIGGIFNLAAVLRDDVIANLTKKDFVTVCTPKILGTVNLDELSRYMCPELDYFICFSSISCGRGNIGQTNYGLANSAMERICENRQASGFPGTAIQWGAIGDTGLVIENLGNNETVIGGTLPQRMQSCLQTMDLFLQQPHAVLGSMIVAEKRKMESSSGVSIFASVANILGIRDVKNVQESITLSDLGMDSLMGTEIKQTLERNFDIVMSPQEIRLLTIGQLKALDDGGSKTFSEPQQKSGVVSPATTPTLDKNQVVFSADLLPTEPVVCLNCTENSKTNPIFMIHAIEGFADPFKLLASRLNVKVYALQCTEEAPLDSIVELAKYHLKHIKKIQPKGPYCIVGYSYGALISSEIVYQLECAGEKAKLILLDGSPKYVTHLTGTQLKIKAGREDPTPDIKHCLGLAYFAFVIGNLDYGGIIKLLIKIPTWEAKLDKIVELLSDESGKPGELIAKTAISFYKKLEIAVAYASEIKLNCDVTLVKPRGLFFNLGEDYGLSEICQGSVNVVQVDGNHRSILELETTLQIIQTLIEKNLMQLKC